MRSVLFCLLCIGGCLPTVATADEATCASLGACIAEIRVLATIRNAVGGLDPRESALIDRILGYDGAVDTLIPLLADPNFKVADIAAAALRNAKKIDPAYLPQVKAGLDRQLGWLPPALGRMDSEAAAREAVARFLVSKDAPENQEAYAVKLSGARAIPFLVDAARCRKSCSIEDQYSLAQVIGQMGPARALAAPGLMGLAQDGTTPDHVATGALLMIAALEADGRALEQPLRDLRQGRPGLANAVDDALVGIGSNDAGRIYSDRLSQGTDIGQLREIATAGKAANAAGPALMRLLANKDWENRVGAVRALGYVGYTGSADALLRLLDDPADVRLNWAAADALGRLGIAHAEPALRRIASGHWFPPVREAATLALDRIAREAKEPVGAERRDRDDFFAYQHMGENLAKCKNPVAVEIPQPKGSKLYAKQDGDRLNALAYTTTILSYGPAEEPPPPKPGEPMKVITVTADNVVEHRSTVSQKPDLALRVEDGWLAGSNRGEWGGELVFIGDDGIRQTLLQENVEDIYQFGTRLVATVGLAHLSMNSGTIYALARGADGRWSAQPWRELPGAPYSSWPVAGGDLLVNVVDGGTILLSPDGVMRMAPCQAP